MTRISFIIPTIGRDSLGATIRSIGARKGDEILVEVDSPMSKRWGNIQRNAAMARAAGDYLAFIDDDDIYVPGARDIMERAIRKNPDVPILFKIQYPNGGTLWKKKKVEHSNVSTQMILVPNSKEKLHIWEVRYHSADYLFINRWKWKKEEIVWSDEIIAYMSRDNLDVCPTI